MLYRLQIKSDSGSIAALHYLYVVSLLQELEMRQKQDTQHITIRVPRELYQQFALLLQVQDHTASQILRAAIRDYVATTGGVK